jgi:hypothetical protein
MLETYHREAEVSFASSKGAEGNASNESQCPVSQLNIAVRTPKDMVLKP